MPRARDHSDVSDLAVVMKSSVKGLPKRAKRGRPPRDWMELFAQVPKIAGKRNKWVCVAAWGWNSTAHQARRRILTGEVQVPGGPKRWELQVRFDEEQHEVNGRGWGLWAREVRD